MCSGFRKNKKGFLGDIVYIGIFMFVFAVMILVGYLMLTNINTNFQASDDISTQAKTMLNTQETRYTNVWDGIFAFIFIGLSIAAIISAFLIDTHPIFFILSLLFIAFFIIAFAILANAYYTLESADAFIGFAEDFVAMHYIMNHLAHYIVIEGFLISLALYAKARS